MKNASRWTLALLFLLSVAPLSAQEPRGKERGLRERGKPLIVDGVQYDRAELPRFKGLVTFWVIERDATYGFTTPEGAEAYGREKAEARKAERPGGPKSVTAASHISASCSGFNKGVGCTGIDWLVMCPLSQYAFLPDSWNDVISCVETGSNVGYYTVLYKCYNFSPTPVSNCWHIIWIGPGGLVDDLNDYDMNNITSSIRFCSNVDPYSCSQ